MLSPQQCPRGFRRGASSDARAAGRCHGADPCHVIAVSTDPLRDTHRPHPRVPTHRGHQHRGPESSTAGDSPSAFMRANQSLRHIFFFLGLLRPSGKTISSLHHVFFFCQKLVSFLFRGVFSNALIEPIMRVRNVLSYCPWN